MAQTADPRVLSNQETGLSIDCEDVGASRQQRIKKSCEKHATYRRLAIAVSCVMGVIILERCLPKGGVSDTIISFDLDCLNNHLGTNKGSLVADCELTSHGDGHGIGNVLANAFTIAQTPVRQNMGRAPVTMQSPVSRVPTSLNEIRVPAIIPSIRDSSRLVAPIMTATEEKESSNTLEASLEASLATAARDARGLAIDAISAVHSGHMGLPLGCAEIGANLWGKNLQYNPEDPQWLNRDRFVLSAGHGSMFIYAWLHLSGYALPMEEVKNFRRHHSMTPGHPEFPSSEHNTPGIEATTGPLGAGIGNAVGMAAAAKLAAAKYNTKDHKIFDHHVIALAGDGCLQEGVSYEAASFAGHDGLDNLIVIYDSNDVTLDKMADFTQSVDHAKLYEALGWNVIGIDGHDLKAVDAAIIEAKGTKNGKPTIIIAKTVIGQGVEEIEGTNAAHGEAGVAYQKSARKNLGLPDDELFYVSPETKKFFEDRKATLKTNYDAWTKDFEAWKEANAELAKELEVASSKTTPSIEELSSGIPEYDSSKNVATRQSGSDVLQYIAKMVPQYVSGSADLHGSNKNYIKDGKNFGNPKIPGKEFDGRNFYFGIREHAMGTMLNGMAYYGLNIPSGSTFLVFSDYMRAAVRVAALSELPTSYILTHDSVGVGEDGPTHQPVEATSGLRIIPNLDVIRPADPEEVAGAFIASVDRKDGPTALILSRQNVRTLNEISVENRRMGTLKGGYVALKETGPLEMILLASGSETQWAMDAAKELGDGVRVVSMPCFERFDRQESAYKAEVLPPSCTKRVAIEAGVTALWYKYVGLDGKVIGTDKFGFSAPGDTVMEAFGITSKNLVVKAAQKLTVNFSPGSLGMTVGKTTGKVTAVLQGQAQEQGVKVDMRLTRIGGQQFSMELLRAQISGTEDYEVEFIDEA